MEPYIQYYDNHAYLCRSYMRNNILRSGWDELECSFGPETSRPQPVVYGSWEPPQRQEGPSTELNTPETSSPPSLSSSSVLAKR